MSSVGALIGACAAGGILLVRAGVAARRPLSLHDRIAPYLAGPSVVPTRRLDATTASGSTLVRLVAPTVAAAVPRLDSFLGGTADLEHRLEASGRLRTITDYRIEQILWSFGGVAIAGVISLLLSVTGRPVRPTAALVLVVVAGLGGALMRDRALTREVARRRDSIRFGLPTVADLLALAVASGESPVAALDRVGRVARGPLAQECRRACADAASGMSFADALDAMANRVDVPAVRRFVDGVAIAVQRGTPLADVLRAQAGDARADVHRSLLEVAGRKELLMLVPVVFLVLPTVVLVALFPAVTALTTVTP